MLLFFVNFYYFIIGGCQLAKYMVNSNSDCPGRAEGTLFITEVFFLFKLYAFILLTSTLVPGINYFLVTTHPLHQLQVRKRSRENLVAVVIWPKHIIRVIVFPVIEP